MRTAAFFLLLVAIVVADVAPLLHADGLNVVPNSYIIIFKITSRHLTAMPTSLLLRTTSEPLVLTLKSDLSTTLLWVSLLDCLQIY